MKRRVVTRTAWWGIVVEGQFLVTQTLVLLPLCWSFVQIISLLDPGLAEDVEDVSICSPDEHLRKRKAISLPIPTSPIVSAPSLGDSSKPVPEKQRLYHNLVVLHGLEIE